MFCIDIWIAAVAERSTYQHVNKQTERTLEESHFPSAASSSDLGNHSNSSCCVEATRAFQGLGIIRSFDRH